jgi:hypothetical protein
MEEKKKQIASIYEELKGVLSAMPSEGSWFSDDGFSSHANSIIERISIICPEITDVSAYKIVSKYSSGRQENTIDSIPTRAKLNSIIGKLKGLFDLEISTVSNGNTFIQNQSQSQEQQQSIVVDIAMKIAENKKDYEEGTSERTFLDTLGETIKTTKSVTEIFSSVFALAAKLGLGIDFLIKIFK